MATYADRLTGGVDYGSCGDAEVFDTPRQFTQRLARLVELWRNADRVVVHTGAGICIRVPSRLRALAFTAFRLLTVFSSAPRNFNRRRNF
jgi:hypothetical protein